MTIQSFTDLNTWKEAHSLVLLIYKETKAFPSEEKFGLIDQLKRSAVSISSNIAEGFSRRSKKEKLMFYFTAKGSLTELQNQILVARDINYLKNRDFSRIAEQTVTVHKLINGLIRSLNTKYQIQNTE